MTPIKSLSNIYFNLWDQDNFDQHYSIRKEFTQFTKKPKPISYVVSKKNSEIPLYGRVYYKSKLIWFQNKNFKHPFRFEMLIKDEETEISVTFWNKLAIDYYNTIQIGDVICLTGYDVKKASQHIIFKNEAVKYEISCNEKKCKVEIGDIDHTFGILDYKLTQTSGMNKGDLINFFGVVVNLGILERSKDVETKIFSQYKWITFLDYSSSSFFYCKVYSNSHLDKLEDIKVGNFVLLTNIEVDIIDIHLFGISTPGTSILGEDEIPDLCNYFNEDYPIRKIVSIFQNLKLRQID